MSTTASLATQESDNKIRLQERDTGAKARLSNKARTECPWDGGLIAKWWLEGWDHPYVARPPTIE